MISRLRGVVRRFYRELIPFIYARRNYKFFMQRTLDSLDLRLAAMLCATNALSGHLRPIPITAPFGRSMLVVAPHHDDEIIGCGGAMLLQAGAGGRVAVVITQDGGDEHVEDGRSREAQIRIREAEATLVATRMGLPAPRFLRYVRLSGEDSPGLIADLRAELIRTQADVVFTPFLLDYNYHHQLTNLALAEALAEVPSVRRVMGYEVWGLAIPNVILRIDSVQDEKRRLLGLYQSQIEGKDYVHGITGLNMFHSLHFGAGECRYAERFFELPRDEFVQLVRDIRGRVTDSATGVARGF